MTIKHWMMCVGGASLLTLAGCVPSGGGGGSNDSGVIPVGGSGGGAGGAGGGAGGAGGGACTPNCTDKACGGDGCGGVCGTCEDGLRCIEGACSDAECPAGTIDCGGVCTEVLSDAANCGNCGNACPMVEGLIAECAEAQCYATCPATRGTATNIDLTTDVENCGSCGNACPSIGGEPPACNDGVCADPCQAQGLVGCGEACVDTQFDAFNCGGCGNVCPTAEGGVPVCEGGQCGDPCQGLAQCGNACIDTDRDDNNCGACGARCTDGQSCNGGICACPDGAVDLDADVENCGACGNACPEVAGGERACNAGRCVDACGGALNQCGDSCVNLSEDANNCGACGTRCGDFQARDLPVRSPLEETGGTVERLDCTDGTCLFATAREYRFPNSGGVIMSCSMQCAEAGMNVIAAPVPFDTCPPSEVPLGQAGVGCAVFRGVNDATARAYGADDPVLPREGFAGANRTLLTCLCEGTAPLLDAPSPGGTVPAPGNYQYEMSDREYLIIEITATGNEVYFEPSESGYVELYSANWVRLESVQELNFRPALIAPVNPGETYYILYKKFPEFGELVTFAIDF